MDIRMVIGDILNSKEDFIMHQCNCVSNTAKGLSLHLFKKFPESDIYSQRTSRDTPGKLIVKGRILNLLAQYYPGKGKYSNDNKGKRLQWFKEKDCLEYVRKEFIGRDVSISFPFKIGCGYGGGDWQEYYKVLKDFDKLNKNIKLVMYKLEEKKKTGKKSARKEKKKKSKRGKKRKSEVIERSDKEEKPQKKRRLT